MIVIEGGGLPCHAGVAGFAISRESGLCMIRTCGGVVILLMARHTIGRGIAVALFVTR